MLERVYLLARVHVQHHGTVQRSYVGYLCILAAQAADGPSPSSATCIHSVNRGSPSIMSSILQPTRLACARAREFQGVSGGSFAHSETTS